ncbi:hypothetical protein FQA39_LY07335 [Lamprigera yunnana]|nr:hypothetical protein FQA39_LY07335 [Lamprigera yunnana]
MLFEVGIFFLTGLTSLYTREILSPPRIVKQPPTDEVLFQVESGSDESNKPFYIECEAVGEPTPKYKWIKNGKNFDWKTYDDRISQHFGRGTLSITKPTNDDIGQYQCFAENEWGIATSNSFFMRRAELNSFENTSPFPLTGNEGEPFKLSCQPPDGWPKPKIYWMIQYTAGGLKSINNSRMTLDPEGNLWFSNLTREDVSDNFMYVCAASSATKLEYKLGNRVLLNVLASGISPSSNKYEPVLQYVTRKNEVALRGKSAELFCIFGGTPLPQTVWSKNGRHIQSSDRITRGNYGKSLVIKLVDFDDEGTYTCKVSNSVGEAKSYTINLKVLAVPYFTKEPEFITAAEDETIELKCTAAGVPEPQIKWIHNGKPIEVALPNPRRRISPNSIIIEKITKKDIGNYGCNATNSLGYIYKDVYVNVLALAPVITEAPKNMEAVDGKDINVSCKVYGAPKPEVKWIHNGKALTGGRYKVLESGDLHISNVQFQDSGDYLCYAENKFGNTNATCKFIVREHTEIRDGPEDYEVRGKYPATFRCNPKHDNNLDLEIIWLNNGQEIDYEEEPRFVKSSDYSLTITKTNKLDSGTYTCVARTRLDQAVASAILIVQDVPNPPQMTGIHCNPKDATIHWMPMGDNRAPILHYIIKYNTSFTPNKWDEMYNKVPPVDMSYNVPMSPWANYTFQVIAVNKIGESDPSQHSVVCTTSPDLPHRNPDNVEGVGDRPDSLVISWTPMPQIEHNAPQFHYKIYWKEDIREKDFETRDILDWQQDHTVIENQPSFKQYRIKVVAVNKLGAANVAAKEVIGYSGENGQTALEIVAIAVGHLNCNAALFTAVWTVIKIFQSSVITIINLRLLEQLVQLMTYQNKNTLPVCPTAHEEEVKQPLFNLKRFDICPARLELYLLCLSGFSICFLLRSSINLTILVMVKEKPVETYTINESVRSCYKSNNDVIPVRILWSCLWYLLASDEPELHPRISLKELNYIQKNREKALHTQKTVPWKSILLSMPVWAIAIGSFGRLWFTSTIIIYGPLFLKTIGLRVEMNGMVISLSYCCGFLASLIFSLISDKMIEHKTMSLLSNRRLFHAVGQITLGMLAIAVGHLSCYTVLIAAVWSFIQIFHASITIAMTSNIVDISPNFTAPVSSLINTIVMSAIPFSSLVTKILLQTENTMDGWREIFYISGGVLLLTYFIYHICSSSDVQEWDIDNNGSQYSESKSPNEDSPLQQIEHISNRNLLKII